MERVPAWDGRSQARIDLTPALSIFKDENGGTDDCLHKERAAHVGSSVGAVAARGRPARRVPAWLEGEIASPESGSQ